MKKQNRKIGMWIVLPILGMVGGGYLLLSTLAPSLPPSVTGETAAIVNKLKTEQPNLKENRLYVPQIGVDVAIVTGVTDETLEGGAWHRKPDQGDPEKGNNFILAAHRFNLGLTPQQTRAKSPFYHIDQLKLGDQFYVDFDGKRFVYEVTKVYKVKESDLYIEDPTKDAKLTMYSCDLRGPAAGREVVDARPVGTVSWVNGTPKVQTQLN